MSEEQQQIGHLEKEVIEVTSLGEGLVLKKKSMHEFSKAFCTKIMNYDELKGDETKGEKWSIERPLREEHVNDLAKYMQRGTFHPEWVKFIICKCLATGKTYRINGQHTCFARDLLPDDWHTKQPFSQVELMEYEATTFADMRQLYSACDRHAIRTKANVTIATLAGTEQFASVSNSIIKLLSEGFSRWFWTSSAAKRLDADEISHLIQTKYYALSSAVAYFLQQEPSIISNSISFLKRAPITAAMLETFQKSTKDALVFWQGMKTGAELSVTDVRLKLRNELQKVSLSSLGNKIKNDVKSVGQEEMYRWCIQAWNAWRENLPLKRFVVHLDKKRPKAK